MRRKGREMRRKKKLGKSGIGRNEKRKSNDGKRRKKLRRRIKYPLTLTKMSANDRLNYG